MKSYQPQTSYLYLHLYISPFLYDPVDNTSMWMSSAALCQRLVKDVCVCVCVPSAGRLTLPTVWLILYEQQTSLNGLDFVACCSFRDMTDDIHTLNPSTTHADTHTRTDTDTDTDTDMHTRTRTRTDTDTDMHTHTHAHTRIHTHTDAHARTHAHTHTHLLGLALYALNILLELLVGFQS